MQVATLTLATVSVSFNAMAQIALRKAMVAVGTQGTMAGELMAFVVSVLLNVWFVAGMGCYALSIGLWLIVLSKLEVSLAYPLLSIGYIITAVVGFFFLNENVGLLRVCGIALISVGLVLISKSA